MIKIKFDLSLPAILTFLSSLGWGVAIFVVWKNEGPAVGAPLVVVAVIVLGIARYLLEGLEKGE